jgi:hypothetical protein
MRKTFIYYGNDKYNVIRLKGLYLIRYVVTLGKIS